MSESANLRAIIDVLTIAIGREEWEEQFFRRSAEASTYEVAKTMFSEIADECAGHREDLEKRKEKLEETLKELSQSEQR
jgi:rubrerythrin